MILMLNLLIKFRLEYLYPIVLLIQEVHNLWKCSTLSRYLSRKKVTITFFQFFLSADHIFNRSRNFIFDDRRWSKMVIYNCRYPSLDTGTDSSFAQACSNQYTKVIFIFSLCIVEKIGLHFQHLCWRVLYLAWKYLFRSSIIIVKKTQNHTNRNIIHQQQHIVLDIQLYHQVGKKHFNKSS